MATEKQSLTSNYDQARTILRTDLIRPSEIMKALDLVYSDEQMSKFQETFPEEAIQLCCDADMFVVAGPPRPMSLLDVYAVYGDVFYLKERSLSAEKVKLFMHSQKVDPTWIVLRKSPVPRSLNRNRSEQQNLVKPPLTVPCAAEVAWGVLTYKAVRGIHRSAGILVRTSGYETIGVLDSDGLILSIYSDAAVLPNLGISACRKF